MAGKAQTADTTQLWPRPAPYFKVSIEDVGDLSFYEVSGLDIELDDIEYSAGDSKELAKIQMPGLSKHGDIILKNGTFQNDGKFWDWIGKTKLNTIKRTSVTISLLDNEDSPIKTWKLLNAWPKKVSVEEAKADTGAEVAIGTLVFCHEGITIE